jgi:hypothetical protein
MAARAWHVAGGNEISIGEQHWRVGFLGFDAGGVDRHDIGAVGEIGDAAEAFRLALGAVDRPRTIETHQLGIGGWVDDGFDLQPERAMRRLGDGEPVGRGNELFGRKRGTVEFQRPQFQRIAVEHERRRRGSVPVGSKGQGCPHQRRHGIERDVEFHGFDEPVGRAVILETNGTGFFGAHIDSMLWGSPPTEVMPWALLEGSGSGRFYSIP